MGLYSNFPYTNFHEMNLDWILRELKELVDQWESFGGNVTSEAHVSTTPEVTVSGNLKTGLNFDFGLVEGPRGQAGPEGPQGPEGKGLEILGVYATLSELQSAHPTGTAGDIYLVGSDNNYVMYVWSEDQNSWLEGGALTSPSPSTTAPLMDGTASAGSLTTYSRSDHVHPSDNSKQDLLVSGTNIKTVDGYSILGNGDISFKTVNDQAITGSGDIEVQETLVSGTNIKTVNSNSLLGAGDIAVQETLVSGTNIKTVNSNSLLGAGDIAVQETLVSGTNIKTINSNSLLGAGDIAVQETLVSGTNIKTVNGNSLLGSGDISIQAGSLTKDVLWTNASASSDFTAQTLNINTNYELFLITCKESTTATAYNTIVIPTNTLRNRISFNVDGKACIRAFTINTSNNSIAFEGASIFDTYGATLTQNNSYIVPYQIIGIR